MGIHGMDELKGTVQYESKERKTRVVLDLCNYGTAQQQLQTLEKFQKEVALQGFRVEYRSIQPM